MLRIFRVGFVRGAIDQMQVQSVGTFTDDDAFPGQRDARIGGVGKIGHEDAFPYGGSLGILDVLHVDNDLGKPFVENARLDFKGHLGSFESIFQMPERGLGSRRKI